MPKNYADRQMAIIDLSFALAHAAAAFPEQRIGQVFSNAVGDPFYMSCDRICEALEAYAKTGER